MTGDEDEDGSCPEANPMAEDEGKDRMAGG